MTPPGRSPATRHPPPVTLHHVVREAAERLAAAGVERPRWTAEQLTAAVLGCEPIALTVDPPRCDPARAAELQHRVARRAAGVPLQQLVGVAGFFGREFRVAPGVFIPRPETERVVEVALAELAGLGVGPATVYDVGTGTGVIAISLTAEHPVGTMVALEISRPALAVARQNGRRAGVEEKVQWVCADLLAPCRPARADLIVANLPYLPSSELPWLPREVRWDPRAALDGGADGLDVIRRLLSQAGTVLRPGGAVVLEVGPGQARQLVRDAAGPWGQPRIVADDTGVERVVVLRRLGHG